MNGPSLEDRTDLYKPLDQSIQYNKPRAYKTEYSGQIQYNF